LTKIREILKFDDKMKIQNKLYLGKISDNDFDRQKSEVKFLYLNISSKSMKLVAKMAYFCIKT